MKYDNKNNVISYPIYGKGGVLRCYTKISVQDIPIMEKYNWNLQGRGYIKARIEGKDKYLHRIVTGENDIDIVIDHINGDPLDNSRCNLRKASRSQNSFNRVKSSNTTSKYKGVSQVNGKWQAYIKMDGVKHVIGHFDTEMEAALHYDYNAKKNYGKFVHPNFS